MTIKITAVCSRSTPQIAIGGKKNGKVSEKVKRTHNIKSRLSEQEGLQFLLKMKNDHHSTK